MPTILLVNPWIHDFAAYDLWARPLGLLKLGTLFESLGCPVTLIDCCDSSHPETRAAIIRQKGKRQLDGRGNFLRTELEKPPLLSAIPRRFARYGMSRELFERNLDDLEKPSLICLTSGMTYWYTGIEETVSVLKSHWPDVPCFLGGIYATLMPEHARHLPGIDRVFPGEPGRAFLEIVSGILGLDLSLSRIQSLLTEQHEPAYHLSLDKLAAVVETSRGCPFRCSYCASNSLTGTYQAFDFERIERRFSHLSLELGTSHLVFYDDALFHNPSRHCKPLFQRLKKLRLPVSFHTPNGLFPRAIDDELAELMREIGFSTLCLSLDSASVKRQLMSGKVSSVDLARAFDSLARAGFQREKIEVYLLTGLPGQGYEEISEGIDLVFGFGGLSRLAQFSPVPQTAVFDEAMAEGMISSNDDPLFQNPTVYAQNNRFLTWSEFQDLKFRSDACNNEVRGMVVQH